MGFLQPEEEQKTQEGVLADRQYQIDAAIGQYTCHQVWRDFCFPSDRFLNPFSFDSTNHEDSEEPETCSPDGGNLQAATFPRHAQRPEETYWESDWARLHGPW